jgi:hypothetical protein
MNEIDLLRDLHWQVRRLMRYNGVDATRAGEAYEELRRRMYDLNDFYERMEDEED